MFENIALSFKGIWSHKVRSVLTMLGIIIGIASIITIVSTIKGTNDQIKENLIGSGTNAVTLSLTNVESGNDYYYDSSSLVGKVSTVDDKTNEELAALDNVAQASSYIKRGWSDGTYYKNQAFDGATYGVDSNYFSVNGYRIDYGRGFVKEDFELCRKVVIVDTSVMNDLFMGAVPVGETIEIKGEPFTVIGVAQIARKSNVVINSVNDYYSFMGNEMGTIFMPVNSWPIVFGFDQARNFAIKAVSTDKMAEAGKEAADYVNKNYVIDKNFEYRADNVMEQAEKLQSLANATNQQLVWIAGIALLVGGIGVMNIMLVSVTERTREIGLKKALGAKKRRILAQFLTEAATLTSIGGLLGVIFGIILAKLISSMSGTPSAISIPACIIAVIFSMAIGIIFGLIPAFKAAKLNPIDALRRD